MRDATVLCCPTIRAFTELQQSNIHNFHKTKDVLYEYPQTHRKCRMPTTSLPMLIRRAQLSRPRTIASATTAAYRQRLRRSLHDTTTTTNATNMQPQTITSASPHKLCLIPGNCSDGIVVHGSPSSFAFHVLVRRTHRIPRGCARRRVGSPLSSSHFSLIHAHVATCARRSCATHH